MRKRIGVAYPFRVSVTIWTHTSDNVEQDCADILEDEYISLKDERAARGVFGLLATALRQAKKEMA